jgi:hypothetical protein
MATTTTNYGFDIPQSTDLVKDGATAIATLGQDIDTAMNTALGTKKAGMVLLNTTSFSGVASQAINDVFSSTYDSYRIIVRLTASTSTLVSMYARLRVGGVDTTTNYKSFITTPLDLNWTAGSLLNATNTSNLFFGYRHVANGSSVSTFDLHYPNIATQTHHQGHYNSTGSDGSGNAGFTNGYLNDTTQYTSINFIPSSGNITGNVSIYGYNK